MSEYIKAADALESLGLTTEHIDFLAEVIFYSGCKLKDEAFGLDSDGDKSLPLWTSLEDAGLIRSVGSYRWELVNENVMNEALKLYIADAYRQAREKAEKEEVARKAMKLMLEGIKSGALNTKAGHLIVDGILYPAIDSYIKAALE